MSATESWLREILKPARYGTTDWVCKEEYRLSEGQELQLGWKEAAPGVIVAACTMSVKEIEERHASDINERTMNNFSGHHWRVDAVIEIVNKKGPLTLVIWVVDDTLTFEEEDD